MQLREKAHLMTGSEINRTIVHLAHEIVDKTEAIESLALIGIRRRGVPLAERLAKKIQQLTSSQIPVGTLDIQLYRDDLSAMREKPIVHPSQIPFSIGGKDVILVDDVLYTGRTTRAALDALFDHGRPLRVRLCVLIDRGHRELPIEASFVGKRVATDRSESIEVQLRETDEAEKVLLLEQTSPAAGPRTPDRTKGATG
jgi:pyrimidine operon attenuation protein/uracil phosphoribosyltransferase